MKKLVLFIAVFISLMGVSTAQGDWKTELSNQLPAMGHRNWILIADAAYPMQIKPGIQTIVTGDDLLDVVKEVLIKINKAPHLSPDVFLDKEIDYVPDKEYSGMKKYQRELDKLLKDEKVTKMLHEELLEVVDEAGQNFKVLVLKTNLTIPYTSVFIRLDCGYWNTDQELQMRETMK